MDFTQVASGFCFLEAPRADGADVWFSDALIGGVHRVGDYGSLEALLPERMFIGGVAINADGALLCSGADGIAWVHPRSRKAGMLLDRIHGEPIFGVSDLLADGHGGLYFGTVDIAAMKAGMAPQPGGLFHLLAGGSVRQLCGGIGFANGIGLSPDGKTLYLNETQVGTWAYELLSDSVIGDQRLLRAQVDCDGLAVDSEGGIWVAGFESGAITRLDPDGTVRETLALPVKEVTSLCFAGADGRDLYVTTTAPGAGESLMGGGPKPASMASLYRGRSAVAGMPIGRTNFVLQ